MVHRHCQQGYLTSPAVIDRSGQTLVNRILCWRHVSMVMSGTLPISATYTSAAPRGTAARKPLAAVTNRSRSRLSLTGHRSSDLPGGMWLIPGETCNGQPVLLCGQSTAMSR